MASYTTNLNLKKPAGSENVAIGDINNNMDAIDTAYGTLNSKMPKTGTITGTTSASGNIAVAGRLLGKNIYCCGCIVYNSDDTIMTDTICTPVQFSITGTGVVLGFNIRSSASPFNAVANTPVKVRYMYFDNEIT